MVENNKASDAHGASETPGGEIGDTVLIYATCPTVAEAERIGCALVDRELVACANVLPGMTSIYVWQGKRHQDSEAVLILKTRAALADRVVNEAKALHPYDNPALVVLPVAGGSADFLAWVQAQTSNPR